MTKKSAILLAATELFAENGYDGTSTAQIAERAGVAHGTLFHHFGNKENLLVEIGKKTMGDYIEGHCALPLEHLTGWGALERSIRFHLAHFQRAFQAVFVLTREMHRVMDPGTACAHTEHFRSGIETITAARRAMIDRGKQDGSIRPCDSAETALVIDSLLSGIIHSSVKGLVQVPDLTEAAVEFCARSLKQE